MLLQHLTLPAAIRTILDSRSASFILEELSGSTTFTRIILFVRRIMLSPVTKHTPGKLMNSKLGILGSRLYTFVREVEFNSMKMREPRLVR